MVIAVDVDGTLDCAGGPVAVERLRELASAGYIIVIVSASGNKPPGFIEVPTDQPQRKESLEEVKRRYPDEKLFMYVSDNPGDDEAARQTGYCYVHPSNFR